MASSPSPPRPRDTVLVTGSSGHLGRALMLSLPSYGYTPIGIDIKPSSTATFIGSCGDASLLQDLFNPRWLRAQPEISSSSNDPNGIEPISHIIHCATLHKPHIESHTKAQFVQTNIADTLTLLEAAAATITTTTSESPETESKKEEKTTIKSFTYISTTSTFGRSLSPLSSVPGAPKPAAHITEKTPCLPKNIYGLTKSSAEDLCYLISSQSSLPAVVLKTSRFFPEADDDADRRASLPDDENLKLCELAYRRVDIADIVSACVASIRAQTRPRLPSTEGEGEGKGEGPKRIKFGKYIISGPSPFLHLSPEDWVALNTTSESDPNAGAEKVFAEVAERLCPGIGEMMAQKKGWKWLSRVDRVYDSRKAMDEKELGWKPEWTFQRALERIMRGEEWRSGLTAEVGKLGYHDRAWGVYTTE